MKKLKKEDYLNDDFDAQETCKSEDELGEGYEYVGWVINPMTTQRFFVYTPSNWGDVSKHMQYILVP